MPFNKKSKSSRVLVLGLALLLVGIAFAFYRLKSHTNMVFPRNGPVIEAVYGLGTVIAPRTYQVKTAVNQSIREIFVKEGDTVSIGTPLMKFDDSGISRAPIAGTITSIPFKRGEILFPGVAALKLVNLSELYIEVSLEQQSTLRVKQEQKAFVSFETLRNEKLEGRVESVFPRDDQFIVRIQIDKFPPGILPGMTADVAIEIGRKENVLSVPVLSISGGKITVRRSGKKLKETIRVGVVDGEWAEVTSGNIQPDDEILVRAK